jgi:hypothetical protein
LLRFYGVTLEARNFTALAKNDADHRQNAERCTACEKHQENDNQWRLPDMIENQLEADWLRVAQGESKQDKKNDEPEGPSQKSHGFKNKKGQ